MLWGFLAFLAQSSDYPSTKDDYRKCSVLCGCELSYLKFLILISSYPSFSPYNFSPTLHPPTLNSTFNDNHIPFDFVSITCPNKYHNFPCLFIFVCSFSYYLFPSPLSFMVPVLSQVSFFSLCFCCLFVFLVYSLCLLILVYNASFPFSAR